MNNIPRSSRRGSRRVGLVAAVAGLLLTVVMAGQVLADGCYGPNQGVNVALWNQTAAKGLTGRMDLKSAQPHSSATTITHPTQILSAVNSDFVGWGAAKGAGTSGGITDCPDNSGTRWAIYVDAITFNHYLCRQEYGSEPDVAANQVFEIKHTACPNTGNTQFVFYWNGDFKTCQAINAAGGIPGVGTESIDYNPQNLDVHYEVLQYRVLGGTWTNWPTVPSADRCVDSGYSLSSANNSTDWTMGD